jgi:hypothetical protein
VARFRELHFDTIAVRTGRLAAAVTGPEESGQALGVPGEFGPDTPEGTRAIANATNWVASPDLARAFRILGRPERASLCDCGRPRAPTLPRTLFFRTDGALLARPKAGRVRTLAGSDRCDAEAD